METENTLAKSLDAADDKAAFDASCKRLLEINPMKATVF